MKIEYDFNDFKVKNLIYKTLKKKKKKKKKT